MGSHVELELEWNCTRGATSSIPYSKIYHIIEEIFFDDDEYTEEGKL
jgi:hypothetical protein